MPALAARMVLPGVLLVASVLVSTALADGPPGPARSESLPPLPGDATWSRATIETRDLPGTDGQWQEGAAVIRAPRSEVLRWLTDYPMWPRRFRDISSAVVLGDDERGRHRVRFRSRIAGAEITVAEEVSPALLVFDGVAWFAFTQGRIHLIDLGDGTTRVLMQSTSQPRGIAKLFATKGMRRDRSWKVARSHLESLDELARRHARGLPDFD
jgi:hypothetical protein